MELLVEALLQWISEHSDMSIEGIDPPEVVLMTPTQLTREFYSDAPHLLPTSGVDDRVNALYAATDGKHGTIYSLAPDFVSDASYYEEPSENPLFREIHLHELVHHVQWQSGVNETWDCAREGEAEAYRLGGLYLVAVGASDPLPNRMFWAKMYSLC
ncbi:hypothetical protein OE699_02225 [Sedimentimonas flavescens]|uniref:Uncharacterized protein n=1 Tax=Sedimentimonas flavescens TaxID=2851012 RepID=A0ABT2ZVI2_9RHOB|nr:hypothetical protein [Sedimentimonas flavescens]MCV2877656.1 hypothetical protein [Sedimentimonas flavescens]